MTILYNFKAILIHLKIIGGIQEQFDIKKLDYSEKSNFWKIIYDGFKKNSIFGCSINVTLKYYLLIFTRTKLNLLLFKKADPALREARLKNGLVRGRKS